MSDEVESKAFELFNRFCFQMDKLRIVNILCVFAGYLRKNTGPFFQRDHRGQQSWQRKKRPKPSQQKSIIFLQNAERRESERAPIVKRVAQLKGETGANRPDNVRCAALLTLLEILREGAG
jgi:hypothetical protein